VVKHIAPQVSVNGLDGGGGEGLGVGGRTSRAKFWLTIYLL